MFAVPIKSAKEMRLILRLASDIFESYSKNYKAESIQLNENSQLFCITATRGDYDHLLRETVTSSRQKMLKVDVLGCKQFRKPTLHII